MERLPECLATSHGTSETARTSLQKEKSDASQALSFVDPPTTAGHSITASASCPRSAELDGFAPNSHADSRSPSIFCISGPSDTSSHYLTAQANCYSYFVDEETEVQRG